ncbi:MAG: hypothetical protein CL917_11230 [Deltaproteobacteria bacterium]|nr:hypothetical protein [Deltaproteobacteria bacterium]
MAQEKTGMPLGLAWTRIQKFFVTDLWEFDLSPRSWTAAAVRLLQFSMMVGQGFVSDRLLLRSSALTFVTALSMIPLLVVVVALIGIVGGQRSLIDLLVSQMTAVSPEASVWVTTRIQEVDIKNLGTLGGATLIGSAILALRHLETTLGEIWGVRQNRNWPRRFADYLAVLVVAPILLGVAVSFWASLGNESVAKSIGSLPLIGDLHRLLLFQLPQLSMCSAFTFLYWFFPNTRVNLSAALVGALVATVLFSLSRIFYVEMSVGAARYSVLFGGLVALPLVLTWIYVCWSVVLFGAEVAFAYQNIAHYREDRLRPILPTAAREDLGVRVMLSVAQAFKLHQGPQTAEALSLGLNVPVRGVREILDELKEAGLVLPSAGMEREPGFVPSAPLSDTTVADILSALRGQRHWVEANTAQTDPDSPVAASEAPIDEIFKELDQALVQIAGERSLSDILEDTRLEVQKAEKERALQPS